MDANCGLFMMPANALGFLQRRSQQVSYIFRAHGGRGKPNDAPKEL